MSINSLMKVHLKSFPMNGHVSRFRQSYTFLANFGVPALVTLHHQSLLRVNFCELVDFPMIKTIRLIFLCILFLQELGCIVRTSFFQQI
jgi:hypothetical protein